MRVGNETVETMIPVSETEFQSLMNVSDKFLLRF